jgi:hypothetical protein
MISYRFVALPSLLLALSGIYGCGGGGESTPVPQPVVSPSPASPSSVPNPATAASQPDEPLTSFFANGEGSVATLTVEMNATGNFTTASGQRYQVQGNGPSGCSVTSSTDREVTVCNAIAGGKAFLLCENVLTPHFMGTLFPQSGVQVGTHWELAGKTLTGLACGNTGPRTNGYTFAFSANGDIAIEQAGAITSTYGGLLDMYDRTTTCPSASFGGWCERWLIYKIPNGSTTQYFLLHLWQFGDGLPTRPVNLFFIEI